MASSIASTASSGYGSQVNTNVNPRYACHWLDSCRGQHELNDCSHWRDELRGKLGVYYSPNGIYKRFARDQLSTVILTHNPTGSHTVHVLTYTIRANGETEILFGLSDHKEARDNPVRRPLLSLPSAQPRKRGEYGMPIARRAFEWISDRREIAERGLKSRFLYQHANVIYPLYVTNEQANLITENFTANEKFRSLHWFPLTMVLERLPMWENPLVSEATENELAQHPHIDPVGVQLGEYQLWSPVTMCLMCIREHVPGGFDTFLRV